MSRPANQFAVVSIACDVVTVAFFAGFLLPFLALCFATVSMQRARVLGTSERPARVAYGLALFTLFATLVLISHVID